MEEKAKFFADKSMFKTNKDKEIGYKAMSVVYRWNTENEGHRHIKSLYKTPK